MWAMMPMLRVRSSEYCRSTPVLCFPFARYMRRGGSACAPLSNRIFSYQRLCANALLASAILCVSSRFFTAVPRLLAASSSSAASFSDMLRSARRRAAPITQRMASDVRRSGRTSTGTWYVEPPTRRDFTSTAGLTLSMAVLNIFSASCLLRSSTGASASYMICSAVDFLPQIIMMLTNFATSREPYLGSGSTSRLAAPARRIRRLRPSAPWRRTFLGGGLCPPSEPPPDRLRRQSRRSNDKRAASGASGLRRLGAVLRAALLASGHPGRVERSADDVIADARQVLHAAATDHDDRVLLEVVSDAGDVRR